MGIRLQIVVILLQLILQGCQIYKNSSLVGSSSEVTSTNKTSWIDTHNDEDFRIEELIEINKIENLVSTGSIIKVHFEGYDIIKETVLENGQEITYEKGVQSDPQFVQDTYTWKDNSGFKSLRTIQTGKDGKEYYYIEDSNSGSSLLHSKKIGDTHEIGIYINDGYQDSVNTYITDLIDSTYTIINNVKYVEERGLYLIGVQDYKGYYYNVYFDKDLMIKEISQEYRYGQNTVIYTIEQIEIAPDIPEWVNEGGEIQCQIIQNNGKDNIDFNTSQGYKNYIYTGDKYKIYSDIPVNTLGAYQSTITNNTDYYVQQDTVFEVMEDIA